MLAHYPRPLRQGRLQALGNAGGFSGARLWRLHSELGDSCVRAWPPGAALAGRLPVIHRLMTQARQAGLAFVPNVVCCLNGVTWVEHAGRVWDVTEWMAGRADFHAHPDPRRLDEACRCLARLHLAWEGDAVNPTGACPAMRRRRQRWLEWQELLAAGWSPTPAAVAYPAAWPLVDRVWRLLPRLQQCLPIQRLFAEEPAGLLLPCLCDVWHDHLLFTGDRLTGLIDYGSVLVDHPAVDLARMLGSLIEDDALAWEVGMQAYRRVRPMPVAGEELARLLDRFGALLGLTTWLRWLAVDGRRIDDPPAAVGRMETLLSRLEKW